ncbi:hypothetical protein FEF65_09700 [Mariprofundus erugo]|uniref:Uncharacterized protein n=1 Tax=Mariprofundus erugo TaxID=2528639 RepID=A0A5R9GS05_9PROT|nr:hypothetical protein [Mariprofundus erugo]TLS66782.1 hypothetical protein FEF65_09700 [Mariprofundus erugo]
MTKYSKNRQHLLSFALIMLPATFPIKGEWIDALLALTLLSACLYFWDFQVQKRKTREWYVWAVYSYVAFGFLLGILLQLYPDSWGVITWLWVFAFIIVCTTDYYVGQI